MPSLRAWRERRRQDAMGRILDVLADHEWHGGYDIGKAARLRPGRLHPALDHLVDKGMVYATWAELEPGRTHRRRMYHLDPVYGGFRG